MGVIGYLMVRSSKIARDPALEILLSASVHDAIAMGLATELGLSCEKVHFTAVSDWYCCESSVDDSLGIITMKLVGGRLVVWDGDAVGSWDNGGSVILNCDLTYPDLVEIVVEKIRGVGWNDG